MFKGTLLMLFVSAFVFAKGKNHIYSSFYIENLDKETMQKIGEEFDVERRSGNGYEVLVRADKAEDFVAKFPQARLVEKDTQDIFRRMDKAFPGWRGTYRDFESVQTEMKELASAHPDMVTIENYGDDDGKPLNALRITGKGTGDKKEVMITSLTHGDEVMTVEVLMDFIQGLVKGYGTDARSTAMIDNHVLLFIPVVCPDGYVNHSRECDGVDPNRNYPYPDQPERDSIAPIKNEMNWFTKHKLAGSLDIHSNLATIAYPWAYTHEHPPEADETRFKEIGQVMANDTGYNFGMIADIIYIAAGSSADYWYWKGKTLAFGYEIGGGFVADPATVHNTHGGDEEAFKHFIEYFK